MSVLFPCPCCGSLSLKRQRDNNIFKGQIYSDRYTSPVAEQNHGHRIKCEACGLQTCWWHLEEEAINCWNTRSD